MGAIKVPTNFNIDLEFEIPEFYKRFLALLIDMLVQYFYLRIVLMFYEDSSRSVDPLNAKAMLVLLPIALYHIFFELTMNGQSPGKKVMGLRVVDENGGRPSISQFVIRWLLRLSDVWIIQILLFVLVIIVTNGGLGSVEMIFVIVFGFGFLITDLVLVISSRKGQRTGDILAKTIVISVRTSGSIEDTVFISVADNYVPSFPQIMQLSDKDINAIKSILETARKKGDFHMATTASEKIKSHLQISSSMSPFDFLDVVMKDYNYLSTK